MTDSASHARNGWIVGPAPTSLGDLDATLTKVSVSFYTGDDDKDDDTSVDVKVQNRGFFFSLDIAVAEGMHGNKVYSDHSFNGFDLPLVTKDMKMSELTFPVFTVKIHPQGNDRWIFMPTFTFTFSNNSQFSGEAKDNIILDQDNPSHTGTFG